METLTNKQFKSYLDSLEIIVEAGEVTLQDEVGTVARYTRHNDESDFEVAMIDRVEYELTEEQKDVLFAVMASESEQYKKEMSKAFSDEDRQHAINLIYS